jgi:hypothetical protein
LVDTAVISGGGWRKAIGSSARSDARSRVTSEEQRAHVGPGDGVRCGFRHGLCHRPTSHGRVPVIRRDAAALVVTATLAQAGTASRRVTGKQCLLMLHAKLRGMQSSGVVSSADHGEP